MLDYDRHFNYLNIHKCIMELKTTTTEKVNHPAT